MPIQAALHQALGVAPPLSTYPSSLAPTAVCDPTTDSCPKGIQPKAYPDEDEPLVYLEPSKRPTERTTAGYTQFEGPPYWLCHSYKHRLLPRINRTRAVSVSSTRSTLRATTSMLQKPIRSRKEASRLLYTTLGTPPRSPLSMWRMSNATATTVSVACTALVFEKSQWLAPTFYQHRKDWMTSIHMSRLPLINTPPIDMYQSSWAISMWTLIPIAPPT